jgi:hypothetical protein
MAAIVISSPGGAQTNSTDTRLPYNNGGVFGDSMLVQADTNTLYSAINGSNNAGFYIDKSTGTFNFGDFDSYFSGNSIYMTPDGNITSYSSKLFLNVDDEITLNGLITSVSAGGSAGLHLKLTINGVKYKIQLLYD